MKKHLKTIVAAVALTIASSSIAAAETVKIGFAAEPYPPFTTLDASGTWVGWEVEIMKAMCAEAKLDCVITPTAWDGIIPALTSKKIDAIVASMSITGERMKTIDFSNKYYNTPANIVGDKNQKMSATADGLKGKIIGVQASTIHQAYVMKYFDDAAAEVKVYQTQDEINQDLVAGRIDATQADSMALDEFLMTPEGKSCCDSKGTVANDEAILGKGVGVGLRKGSDALKAKFNAAIVAIRANGKFDEISKKYFNFDIYGG